MKAVWKYAVDPLDQTVIDMPRGAEVLKAGLQNGALTLWAMVDPDARLVPHKFAIAGTGHPREDLDDADYVGTVLLLQDTLVFHIFDLGEMHL